MPPSKLTWLASKRGHVCSENAPFDITHAHANPYMCSEDADESIYAWGSLCASYSSSLNDRCIFFSSSSSSSHFGHHGDRLRPILSCASSSLSTHKSPLWTSSRPPAWRFQPQHPCAVIFYLSSVHLQTISVWLWRRSSQTSASH